VGETLELDVAFPSEFRNPALAGKLAQVRLGIAEVREPVLPELDADFIRGFGVADGEIGKFRSEVRANLERELHGALLARLKGEVAQKLATAHPDLELPKVMIEAEARAIARMGLPEGSEPGTEMVVAAYAPARLRVAAALLMGEIARRNNITADSKRVAEMLAAIASTYEEPQRVVELYRNDPQLMEGLRNRVLEDQVAEWVAEHARVTDKPMSFDELLRPGRTG
jgi:trigger factor